MLLIVTGRSSETPREPSRIPVTRVCRFLPACRLRAKRRSGSKAVLTSKKICVMGASRTQVRDLIHIQRNCGPSCHPSIAIAHISAITICLRCLHKRLASPGLPCPGPSWISKWTPTSVQQGRGTHSCAAGESRKTSALSLLCVLAITMGASDFDCSLQHWLQWTAKYRQET